MIEVRATLPERGRDLRLDLFRGIANWAIYLDHIPNNIVNWITTRNYGFSDAADLFVFISGYTASFVYARMMMERGFLIGATRLFKRVWQLYMAHIFLLFIYVASVGYVATRFRIPEFMNEFNVAGLVDNAVPLLGHGLLLGFKPLNLDVLPLYIVLMAFFPYALWLMLRLPHTTMLLSITLYFSARHYGWNLPAYPNGSWYFNPFTWQVLFMFGAWFALGGANLSRKLINSRSMLFAGIAYLLFAAMMTIADHFPQFGQHLPDWLLAAFIPNDKTNMAPYRLIHFIVVVFLVTRFLAKDWRGLEWPVFRPVIKCGQQSLAVFCVGIFLSFAAHLALTLSSGSLVAQISASVTGIAIMIAVAYYMSWSKGVDKRPPRSSVSP